MFPLLDETAVLIRHTVAQFAQNEIAPIAHQIDTSNQFPTELWSKMGDLGLLGITVDAQYGGAQLGYSVKGV